VLPYDYLVIATGSDLDYSGVARLDRPLAIGVAVAIAPPGLTPVPVGVPKTGNMTVNMARAAAQNLADIVRGRTPQNEPNLGVMCMGDMGDEAIFLWAKPALPSPGIHSTLEGALGELAEDWFRAILHLEDEARVHWTSLRQLQRGLYMSRIEAFEDHAKQYDAWVEGNQVAYEAELKAIRAVLPARGHGLEIGVGTARLAAPLHDHFGVDPTRAVSAIARTGGVEVASLTILALRFSKPHACSKLAGALSSVLLTETVLGNAVRREQRSQSLLRRREVLFR